MVMMARDMRRFVFAVGPLLVLVYIFFTFWSGPASGATNWFGQASSLGEIGQSNLGWPQSRPGSDSASAVDDNTLIAGLGEAGPGTHHEIFSVSTPDRKYFKIQFGAEPAINPNIIPHPIHQDTYIIVAQAEKKSGTGPVFSEIICPAVFVHNILACSSSPSVLPIAATSSPENGSLCQDDLSVFNLNVGPHDARVFYGPQSPFVLYGSNSGLTCFGQWLQDLRPLLGSSEWGVEVFATQDAFRVGQEIHRPPPYAPIEKNWFVFWDAQGRIYAHYDVSPKRAFAALRADGTVGYDLAPLAAERDERCMDKYLPKLLSEDAESIHQATNSLAVTLCRRADPACKPSGQNTFVFTIVHYKKFYNFHAEYEPYVLLFRQREPFELFAVAKRPLWIHGRQALDEAGKTEMFFVTSMSWKTRGQKYHGFIDDVLFLSFGIEDKTTAGMDVLAGDILKGLGHCSDT